VYVYVYVCVRVRVCVCVYVCVCAKICVFFCNIMLRRKGKKILVHTHADTYTHICTYNSQLVDAVKRVRDGENKNLSQGVAEHYECFDPMKAVDVYQFE